MKASSFPPLPSPLLSSPGESLDLFGRTTTALMASLPLWRRRFGCSACGGRLLVVVAGSLWRVSASAPAFAFIVIIVWVALVAVWRMLCRFRGLGGCLATLVCYRSLYPWHCNSLLQVSVAVVSRFAGLPVSSPFFMLYLFLGRLPSVWWWLYFRLIASAY